MAVYKATYSIKNSRKFWHRQQRVNPNGSIYKINMSYKKAYLLVEICSGVYFETLDFQSLTFVLRRFW